MRNITDENYYSHSVDNTFSCSRQGAMKTKIPSNYIERFPGSVAPEQEELV